MAAGFVALVAGWLAMPSPAAAMGTDGTARNLVFPVVVSTGSYTSQVHLFNADTATRSATITYHGSLGTTSPGERPCYPRLIAPGGTADFDLNALCNLGPGTHYGLLRVSGSGFLSGYSRVSNPQGNGFSVDAFPAGQFFGGGLNVLGLRKSALAPGYGTNCFVASLDETASYSIRLYDQVGSPIGSPITGGVGANQLVRHLDVFAAAGAAGVEFGDVRAEITATDPNTPALLGFCTVQNNTNFDADFRIGKSRSSPGADAVKTFTGVGPAEPIAAAITHRFATIVAAPDVIACSITGASADSLELRLLGPDGKPKAGGPQASSFSAPTGARSAHTGGEDGVWTIEVRPRAANTSFPLAYALDCRSGNGMSLPVQLADGAAGAWSEPPESQGSLVAGVRLLDDAELAAIVSESASSVVLPSTSPLQAGDVFVTPNGAYRVDSRTDDGGLATLAVASPPFQEVFARLRIRDGTAAAPVDLQGQARLKSESIDVEVGADYLSATFSLAESGFTGSGGFTVRVIRWKLETDLEFNDLFDPEVKKSALLELALGLESNLSVGYNGGNQPLEKLIGKLRIPVRTSIVDAVTGAILGRTAVAIVIPVSIILDANASLNATGTATLESRFTYSPANGAASAVEGNGSFAFGAPDGGAAATAGASVGVILSLRARPALGFFDPVALLGLDLRAGAELEGKVEAKAVDPFYCLSYTRYARFSAAGFFSTVGMSTPLETPTLLYRPSLEALLGGPLQVGACAPPPLPPQLDGLSCGLETDARGYWRWAISGSVLVDAPIAAGDTVGVRTLHFLSPYNNSQLGSAPAPESLDCGSLALEYPGGWPACVAPSGSSQSTSITVKLAGAAHWFCDQHGCWGPFGYGFDYAEPLSLGASVVARDVRVYAFRHGNGTPGSLVEGVLACPDPRRLP